MHAFAIGKQTAKCPLCHLFVLRVVIFQDLVDFLFRVPVFQEQHSEDPDIAGELPEGEPLDAVVLGLLDCCHFLCVLAPGFEVATVSKRGVLPEDALESPPPILQ